jgi:hypothetical protein
MKQSIKDLGIVIGGIIGGTLLVCFLVYFFISLLAWFFSDPLNIFPDNKKCDYESKGTLGCMKKEEYCREETRKMFLDLNDTMGSDTNNQDQMSKSMLEVYNKCLETE